MHPKKFRIILSEIFVRLIAINYHQTIFVCRYIFSVAVTESKATVFYERKQDTVEVITGQMITSITEKMTFAKDIVVKLFRKDRP
jgi:hypothetical protein